MLPKVTIRTKLFLKYEIIKIGCCHFLFFWKKYENIE